MSKLSEMLVYLRKREGMSQVELARALGITRSALSMYEADLREPDLERLERIADFFNVNMDTLTGRCADSVVVGRQVGTASQRPRLGTIACGAPILAEQNIEAYDSVPDYIKCDFTLVCKGDSMTGARIYDGDIVCIKQQATVENGQIAAVLVGDEATLKRVRFQGDSVVLWPENPNYAPMVFTGEDVNNVRILGLATHFISKVV